jgi:transposase-like protein
VCKQVSVSLPYDQYDDHTGAVGSTDQLLANYEKPEALTGEDGLFKQLKMTLSERALGGELTEHLDYEKGDPAGRSTGNSRNGTSSKTILTEDGEIENRYCGPPRSRR